MNGLWPEEIHEGGERFGKANPIDIHHGLRYARQLDNKVTQDRISLRLHKDLERIDLAESVINRQCNRTYLDDLTVTARLIPAAFPKPLPTGPLQIEYDDPLTIENRITL